MGKKGRNQEDKEVGDGGQTAPRQQFSDMIQQDRDSHRVARVSLVLYQPEIPGNTGTLMRLAACWGAELMLIGPLGFVWSDRHLKRARMDYATCAACPFYDSWSDYVDSHHRIPQADRGGMRPTQQRMIAVVPLEGVSYTKFAFTPGDHLIMGSESCGLPRQVINQCHEVVHIPMRATARSLNLAIASAIVWSEALRQTNCLD
jgi:tRNA (cytidine/uridine-2'-O-)-methyltransferase